MRLQEAVHRRVAIVVKPAVDESLLGYLTRVAETNVLERPADILHEICAWPAGYLAMRQSDLFIQPKRPWNAGRLIGP